MNYFLVNEQLLATFSQPILDNCVLCALKVTRELTYLDGTADGQCRTRMFEGARVLGDFEHNCTVLTQMTIAADANGDARCVGMV